MDNQKINENNENNGNNDELLKCRKDCDEYLDGWKRAKADLINYKKNEAQRFETMIKFSNEALIRDLITVLDNFDLALLALERDAMKNGGVEKGVYLIRTQLEDILKQNGLERVIILVGSLFDPGLAEAIVEVESDKPTGTIIEEVERGYLLHGKLIRPVRVKVAK